MAQNPLLAKIHIARKDLALSVEDYRAILQRLVGQETAAGLPASAHEQILAEFARLGWRPRFEGKQAAKPQVRLVYGLWGELGRLGVVHGGRVGLLAFIERQIGRSSAAEWLSATELNKVTEGLKAMKSRAKKERAA